MTISFVSLERERIQKALITRAEEGPFYRVQSSGNEQAVREAVAPAQILANETSATFGEALRGRRIWKRERTSWTWELRVGFNTEVSVEAFEQEISDDPILLPRDDEHERQVRIFLVSSRYDHPPRQSQGNGTQVVFTLEANLSPV